MRIVVSHLGLRELLLLMGVYMMVMKIVSKNSFKVVKISVESDWRNIHKKMREAWGIFRERVEEIKERKGDYISILVWPWRRIYLDSLFVWK